MWEVLFSWLPQRYRYGYAPRPLYSTETDGWSLQTLYASAVQPPYVLLMLTDKGCVVGAFIPIPLNLKEEMQTSGEIFLFCVQQSGTMKHYVWDGGERVMIVTEPKSLSVSGNALFIDSELSQGVCQPSAVFGMKESLLYDPSNPTLKEDSFKCIDCELWNIVPN